MSDLSQFYGGLGAGWRMQIFVTSGTWVCPEPDTEVSVIVIGGGQGGGGGTTGTSPATGSVGGASSFGALVTAPGGSRAAGDGAQRGQDGIGQSSTIGYVGTAGGAGVFGFGAGGAGGQIGWFSSASSRASGHGGNSGAVAFYQGTLSANQTVTVGTGGSGSAGSSPAGANGQNGSDGAVIVYWKEQ